MLAAAVVILGTAGAADAQVVSFTGSGYQAGQGGRSATIAPYGTFSTQPYPNGGAPMFQVWVSYGIFDNGVFKPYAQNSPGIPNATNSTAQNVNRGGGPFDWSIPIMNCNVLHTDIIRAQLQQSTDGGKTWTNTGSPSYINCW